MIKSWRAVESYSRHVIVFRPAFLHRLVDGSRSGRYPDAFSMASEGVQTFRTSLAWISFGDRRTRVRYFPESTESFEVYRRGPCGFRYCRLNCQGVSIVFEELAGGRRCSECGGTGDCQQCFGTGRNVALNSDQDKCLHCGGTGRCSACSDTGIITLGLSDS